MATTNCLAWNTFITSNLGYASDVVSSGGHPWLYHFLEAFPWPNDCSHSMELCLFVEIAGGVGGVAFGSGSLQHPNYLLENRVLEPGVLWSAAWPRHAEWFFFLFLDIAQWVESKTWSCEAGLDTCVATRDVLWLLLVCAVCMTLFCNFSMDYGLFKRLHTKNIKNMKREYDILIWFETFCSITRVLSVEFTLDMIAC